MKTLCKKIVCSMLFVIMMITTPLSAFAFDNTVQEQATDLFPTISKESRIFASYADGTEVVAAYKTTDDGLVKLTKEEYTLYIQKAKVEHAKKAVSLRMLDLQTTQYDPLEKFNFSPNIVVPSNDFAQGAFASAGSPITWYKESGSIADYNRTILRTEISNRLKNSSNRDASMTFTTGFTQSATSSISLGYTDKSAIATTVGLSYSNSYSVQESATANVAPGYTGWIEFYPVMYNTWGYLQYGVTTNVNPFYVIYTNQYVDIYFPKRTSAGLLKGIYEVKAKK